VPVQDKGGHESAPIEEGAIVDGTVIKRKENSVYF